MVLEDCETDRIEGCRRGDPEAFRALFEKHKDMVYSITSPRYKAAISASRRTSHRILSWKLFSTVGSFPGRFSIPRGVALPDCGQLLSSDQKRRTRRLIPLLDEVLSVLRTPDLSVLDEVLRSEMSTHVRAAIDSLAPDQRMVIVLRYTQGLSYDEIAGILGCASGTIASRLNRAHKVLARRLSRLAGTSLAGKTRRKARG